MSWNDDDFETEPEVSTREIEEIPWGVGWLYLQKAMVVEVEENEERGLTTISCEDLDLDGSGDCYEAALEEFGAAVEEQWDDLVEERNLMPSSEEKLTRLRNYIGG